MLTIVETPVFSRRADKLLKAAERDALTFFLAGNPLAGDLIPGTGGLRKLRWAGRAKGKSGGFRVVYYFYDETAPLFALMIYGKGERGDLSPDQRRFAASIAARVKAGAKKKRIGP